MARMIGARAIELPTEPTRKGDLSVYDRSYGPDETKRAVVRRFIEFSRKRWQTSDSASSTFRRKMRIDQLFASGGGNQWDPVDRQQRADEGRPCLEINRIPQFIRQVSNQQRANRSQIQVNPRGGGAVRETADTLQGLIRAIEVDSDADIAYDTGSDHQLLSGLGFVRLRSAWADKIKGFEQVCKITRVRNPLSVYWDPSAQEADFGDARWFHIIGVIGRDEYEDRWGKISSYQSLTEFMRTDATLDDWAPEVKVVIAEYFYVETENRVLLQLEDGEEVWREELEDFHQAWATAYPGSPAPGVMQERTVQAPVVKWALHNAIDILEGNEDRTAGRTVPGTRIPVYPVVGEERDIDGTVDYRGMVRDGIDPARMYNFWASSIAEAVALAPKAPWIAAAGQINQYLDDWKTANRVPHSVLQYDPKSVDGTLVPPPQRVAVEPAIQAMVQGLREADGDLKAVMGLFEPSLGERGPEKSGKAIIALQQQGQTANSNYLDNLQRTKRSVGKSLLEWIPIVYDTARLVHLVQPDGKKKPAMVHSGTQNAPDEASVPKDVSGVFDLNVGLYEIAISTGPSFESQRQQTEAWLLELFKVLPGLANIGADIVLENSDNPAAQQLAKRARAMLPPQFQDQDDAASKVPQLLQALKQAEDHAQIAHAAITKMAKVIEESQIESATKIEVATISARAQEAVALIKAGSTTETHAAEMASSHFENILDHAQDAALASLGHEQALTQDAQAATFASQQQAEGSDQQGALQKQAAGHASAASAQGASQQADLEKQKADAAAKMATKAGPRGTGV